MSRKKFTTYIEEDLIKKLKMLAIEEDKSAADIINELLKKKLEV
ncbi:MAG: hypothetical protein ACRDA4_08225 [Filifactoraceae bacterium]